MDERLASANIAIIDDEVLNVRFLERFLRVAGFAVLRSWMDPVQAVADLESEPADIVLLDLMMPEMDGYAVLQLLRQRDGEGLLTPVVVLTADVTQGAKQRALELGATDFLTKPFDQTEISLRVRNILTTRFLEVDLLREKELLEVRVRERTAALRANVERLRLLSEQRERLIRRLTTYQERERKQIADDIHRDTIGTMVALKLRLELARRKAEDPALRTEIDKAVETVQAATASLRELLFQLHPVVLENDGLQAALRAEIEHERENAAEGGPEFSLTGSLVEEPVKEKCVTLFRIAQEGIANARRHAHARSVRLDLNDADGGVRLLIIDDGLGMDPELARRSRAGHLGLVSMRERAELSGGSFTIESEPGKGTTIDVWIPGGPEEDLEDDRIEELAAASAAVGADHADGEPAS